MSSQQPSEEDPTQEDSFVKLVGLARDGDQSAVGQLVEQYRNYLLLIANEDIEDRLQPKLGASDLVQQSIILAQRKFGQFRGQSEPEFLAWLKTILRNNLLKNRHRYATRKRNAHQEVHFQDHSAIERGLSDDQLTPSSEAVKQEKERALSSALARLAADHQTIIRLRNFEQLSFEEIGNQMDRSPDAARKLWSRAINALQTELTKIAPELISGIHPIDEQS